MKIAIIGRTEILYETARQLHEAGHEIVCILTAKEAPEYTRNAEDFRHLAEQWNIPYACSAKISEHQDFLAASKADIGVSINYSGVIPDTITNLFGLGILNAHGGDLPRYRGNACQAWAILNGEEKIGLCIHRMIGGELDSGDIIARAYLPIDINSTIEQAMDWISSTTPGLFNDALKQLQHDPEFVLERQSKDPSLALRCYPRRPEDGRIDWSNSAVKILRLINASGRPYPGAFCFLEDKRITVWQARLGDDERFLAVPGQVTAITPEYLEIATGDGKVRLTEMDLDNTPAAAPAVCKSIRTRLK
ncbi:methionyl-tRNA formyltransferase [Herbaspirillum sp.]|uniref:methionyl-tRNA formyltransferase n=1 Tax=Herbaspirillum sp. TaxID=1890675 RepID=UPI001B1505C0|nr:methionyl-tRNA formyltransferase [Herbaspirillum sp.]MBO9536965.1 methionyl-tRNA formyltransferase [Herbaspirillum sp.]